MAHGDMHVVGTSVLLECLFTALIECLDDLSLKCIV